MEAAREYSEYGEYGELAPIACWSSAWVSDSAVACGAGGGVGGGVGVAVSVGAQVGSVSAAVSYDGGVVVGVNGSGNAGTTGGASVSVVGVGFGMEDRSGGARLGGSSCGAFEWTSSSSVRSLASAGVGGTLRAVVSVWGQSGSASGRVSYDGAGVSSAGVSNAAVSGGSNVTVVGSGMGVAEYSAGVRTGGSACWSRACWRSTL